MLTLFAYLAAVTSSAAMTAPELPKMPSLTAADCNNDGVRNQKLKQFNEDDSWTRSADKFNADWQSYVDARMAKLGMTESEKQNLMEGVATSDAFQALQTKNEAILAKMADDLESIDDVEDEAGACRVVAKMLTSLGPIMTNAEAQWKLVDQAVNAEAQRRGIKLD